MGVLLGALLLALPWRASLGQGEPAATAPAAAAPGVPDRDCCLVRLNKGIEKDSFRKDHLDREYKCPSGLTTRGKTEFQIHFTKGETPCDENPQLIPPNSVLHAEGTTIRRADGFSHFHGDFTIAAKVGKDMKEVVLFKGQLEVIGKCGPEGKCALKDHMMGWLTGKGVTSANSRFNLRAVLDATYFEGKDGKTIITTGHINGVAIDCPAK
jgi:hypothetical protein